MGMQIRVFLGLGKNQARIVLARRRSAFPMPSAFPSVQAHRVNLIEAAIFAHALSELVALPELALLAPILTRFLIPANKA